jgi:general secretion pathway protein G
VRKSSAFTLIELLIVVAIIAILAAIAVPNFLEAQTRSKVSRVKSDMRTLATAIEAYRIDHNLYPQSTRGQEIVVGVPVYGTLWVDISTPVAYITNAFMTDVFNQQNFQTATDEALFTYQNLVDQYCGDKLPDGPIFSETFCQSALDFYGGWRLGSVGPDMDFDIPGAPTPTAQTPYDSTNGTVSAGNIWRSQNHTDNEMPNDGTLVGGL